MASPLPAAPMRRRFLSALAVWLLLLPIPGSAQSADEMTVELIVFAWEERPGGQNVDAAALPGPGQTLVGGTSTSAVLDESALTLHTARERLAGARQTRLLLHLAWRQTLADSRWVRLDGQAEGLTLEGRLRVQGSRTAEAVVELLLTDATGQRWLLRQQRNLRPGTAEYLDHPALGVILRTTPYASLVNDADL